jgi:hypothetical protein
VCRGGGFDLFVRTRLDAPESFDWEPLPAVVDQACARLATHAPELPGAPVGGAPSGAWRLRPMHAVVGPLLVLVVALFPRRAEAVAAGLVALGVRLWASPCTVLFGGDASYERLLEALGLGDPNLRYGDTWAAVMGLVTPFAGTDGVHLANLGISALGVALLSGLAVDHLGRLPGAIAGLTFALLPLPISLAGTEIHDVLVSTLQVAAVYGAMRPGAGPWLGALATGALAHLRPEQVPFTALPVALLLPRRGPALLAAALVAWRVVEMIPQLGAGAPVDYGRYLEPQFLRRLLTPGPGAVDVSLDTSVTPLAVPGLAVLGGVVAFRAGPSRPAAVALAALALTLLPVLPKTEPASDPLRFQLPAQAWIALLAGIGAAACIRRGPLTTVLAAMALLGSALGLRPRPVWAWQAEYDFLRGVSVPEGRQVLYDDSQDPNGKFREWLQREVGGTWVGGGSAGPDQWVYRGTADRLSGRSVATGPAMAEAWIPAASDGWVDFGPGPIRIGLYGAAVPP